MILISNADHFLWVRADDFMSSNVLLWCVTILGI